MARRSSLYAAWAQAGREAERQRQAQLRTRAIRLLLASPQTSRTFLAAVAVVAAACGASGVYSPPATATPTPPVTSNPTRGASATLQATPTGTQVHELSLQEKLQAVVDGTLQIPRNNKFKVVTGDAPENLVQPDSEIAINNPQVGVDYQGFPLGGEVVNDNRGGKHLVEYIAFESKEDPAHPNGRTFYVPFDLGRVGSTDFDNLDIRPGGFMYYDSGITQRKTSVADLEQVFAQSRDRSVAFGGLVDTVGWEGPDNPSEWRSRAELRAQNPVARAIIAWMQKTRTTPWQQVPMDALTAAIVNRPVTKWEPGMMPTTTDVGFCEPVYTPPSGYIPSPGV